MRVSKKYNEYRIRINSEAISGQADFQTVRKSLIDIPCLSRYEVYRDS